MMTILTLAQVREHVETGLSDTALQRLLDAEDGEIVRRYGAPSSQTETLPGGGRDLFLSRPVTSLTSITETRADVATLLGAGDYTLWAGGRIERDDDGSNPADTWGESVTVVYVPQDQTALRCQVLVQLIQLGVQYNGLQAESVGGDYSTTSADYLRERERLYRQLAPRGGVFLA